MKSLNDVDFLLQRQYRDGSNLQARIAVHQRFSTNPQGIPRWFIEHLQVDEGADLLEVGCGPGGYWAEVAEEIPPSWRITVSDFSPGMVAEARQRLATLARPFTVVQADVQDLPFPARSFDAVIANFMLYHVPNRRKGLAEIHRVLRPNGCLFALTNGRRHMQEFHELVDHLAPGTVRRAESGFSLENGAAQLAAWFDPVQVVRYPDALRVTEVDPLLAYLRSYLPEMHAEQERAVRQAIEAELAVHGAWHIGKDAGLFIGVRR